jgi:hypothetical protein
MFNILPAPKRRVKKIVEHVRKFQILHYAQTKSAGSAGDGRLLPSFLDSLC